MPARTEQGIREQERTDACVKLAVSPELAALRVIASAERRSGLSEQIDQAALLKQLRQGAAAVQNGNLSGVEGMLENQARALQTLFASLAERAMRCDTVDGFESNMRIALRAQAQCRATVETLSAIKHPPLVFARQANVTTGPQQVNNSFESHALPEQSHFEQSKLSGAKCNELRPDARPSSSSRRAHSAVEAVGAVNGTKVSGR